MILEGKLAPSNKRDCRFQRPRLEWPSADGGGWTAHRARRKVHMSSKVRFSERRLLVTDHRSQVTNPRLYEFREAGSDAVAA